MLRFLSSLDPPGWIVAWFCTFTVFGGIILAYLGVGRAFEAFKEFGSVIATVYVTPLATWLAYKGWKNRSGNANN